MDTSRLLQTAMASAAGEPAPAPRVPTHYHWLLRLPPRFWSRMHLYLDYIDILNLALLSSEFRNERVERYLPWTVRHAVVARRDREAAAISPTSGQQQRCACYLCFCIKSIDEFQKPADTFMFARVLQRDVYTGDRTLQPVPPPSPGDVSTIVQPPPMPVSPHGGTSIGGVGSRGVGGTARGSSVFFAAGAPLLGGGGIHGAGGMPLAISSNVGGVGNMGRLPTMGGVGGMGGVASMGTMGTAGGIGAAAAAAGQGGCDSVVGARSGLAQGRATAQPGTVRSWVPRAPGAEVGKIESLRSYCIACALQTGLSVPGDLITTRGGQRLWVCHCRVARDGDDNQRCVACGMCPVYRD